MAHEEPLTGARLRTPRAAAVAGILFSLLLGLAITLINVSAPSHPARAGDWLTDPARRAAIAVALNLVPFAGIAFLWFIGVVRDRIGQREDRFFASVFLGSGLLFVAMLFAAAAFAGGLIALASLLLVAYLAIRRLLFGPEAEGVFTLFGIAFFLIGVALIGLGVVGEYVGRIYEETKRRPNYIVAEVFRSKTHPLNLLGRSESGLRGTEIPAGSPRRRP